MQSLNKVMLIGNIGNALEIRSTRAGEDFVKLSLATSEYKKREDGSFVSDTEWHSVYLYGERAFRAAKSLRKGMKIFIEGRLKKQSWEDRRGRPRLTVQIIASNFIPLEKPADTFSIKTSSSQEKKG